MSSKWVKCISQSGTIRGVAVEATDLVQQIVRRHKLSESGAIGLGEAVVGALLLASNSKQGERINLNIQGSGFYKQTLVDADYDGTVRGYVIERDGSEVDLMNLGPWGSGLISVLRTRTREGEQPYIGTVPLVTGHLAKDLTFYWAQSEQVPSAAGVSVQVDERGDVTAASGFLIQAMPGASTEEIKLLDSHIRSFSNFPGEAAKNPDPASLLSKIFHNTVFLLLESKELAFKCSCSQERVERALSLFGSEELQTMLKEDKKASVRCDFCGLDYVVQSDRLKELIKERIQKGK